MLPLKCRLLWCLRALVKASSLVAKNYEELLSNF